MRYIDGKKWAQTWRDAGPRLDAIRERELRSIDVPAVLASFADAFEAATRTVPPGKPTSGLIEQQRLFARLAG